MSGDHNMNQKTTGINEQGMTLRQYAAIHLKVPNSGTDWLDAMIKEANKLDGDYFAAKAMQAYCSDPDWRADMGLDETAYAAYQMAKAMLKARNE